MIETESWKYLVMLGIADYTHTLTHTTCVNEKYCLPYQETGTVGIPVYLRCNGSLGPCMVLVSLLESPGWES